MQKYAQAFGKNDIRGIYGDDITEELYYNIGISFIEWLRQKSGLSANEIKISVCRDTRLHSPSLTDALISGITSTDAKVIDLGLAPTPLGYYSDVTMDVVSTMIVTASHNPKEYNGIKMTYNNKTLNEVQIKELKEITLNNWFRYTKTNVISEKYDIIPKYINDISTRFGKIGNGIKVVVDSANATGGLVGPELYRKLGCEVIELYSEPDGNFPNHHPNPSDLKTLNDIKLKVRESNADVGIAYDGDSDRIGVIDSSGNALTGDKLLLIYALDMIEKGIKPTVVSEVKCSQVLYDTINNLGGNAIMTKTGHGYIKDKMKETNAILAGEMSGHTFFKDKYYGYDDAIYAGCRIIEIIAKNKGKNPDFKIQNMLTPFDKVFTSDEVRYPCPNELKSETLDKLKNLVSDELFGIKIKDIVTIDGMRIIFDGGFALIRQSNTEPVFTLRFEARTQDECEHLKTVMVKTLGDIIDGRIA